MTETTTLTFQGARWELTRGYVSVGANRVSDRLTYNLSREVIENGVRHFREVFAGYSRDRAIEYLDRMLSNRPVALMVVESFDRAESETTRPKSQVRGTGLPTRAEALGKA